MSSVAAEGSSFAVTVVFTVPPADLGSEAITCCSWGQVGSPVAGVRLDDP